MKKKRGEERERKERQNVIGKNERCRRESSLAAMYGGRNEAKALPNRNRDHCLCRFLVLCSSCDRRLV